MSARAGSAGSDLFEDWQYPVRNEGEGGLAAILGAIFDLENDNNGTRIGKNNSTRSIFSTWNFSSAKEDPESVPKPDGRIRNPILS